MARCGKPRGLRTGQADAAIGLAIAGLAKAGSPEAKPASLLFQMYPSRPKGQRRASGIGSPRIAIRRHPRRPARWTARLLSILVLGLAATETMVTAAPTGWLPLESMSSTRPVRSGAVAPLVRNTGLPARAQDLPARPDRDGQRLRQRLQSRQSARWNQIELARVLSDDSWQELALWLDRRVDDSRLIDLEVQNQARWQVLEQLAGQANAGIAICDHLLAVVPRAEASRLPLLLADARFQARQLADPHRRVLLAPAAVGWPRLTQPARLLEEWCQAAASETRGIWNCDPLPHDVWDRAQLPEMSLIERIALLAFGFGRRVQLTLDDQTLQIAFPPYDDRSICHVRVEDRFWRAELNRLRAQLPQRFPDVTYETTDDDVPQLAGTLGQLATLLDLLEQARPQPGAAAAAEQRYTLKVEGQTAEAVIQVIAKQTERQLVVEGQIDDRLSRMVRLDVREATLDGLMAEIARQADLEILVGKTQITLRPRSE